MADHLDPWMLQVTSQSSQPQPTKPGLRGVGGREGGDVHLGDLLWETKGSDQRPLT